MFKKLVSNLPFSPSLLPQLSFYAKRLGKENSIRRIGMVFAVVGLLAQSFISISPPVSASRPSTTDIIYGGIGTSEQAAKNKLISILQSNVNPGPYRESGLRELFAKYGIDEAAVRNATLTTICSQCSPADKQLHSMGRNRNSRVPSVDKQVNVAGQTYYSRPLHIWDTGPHSKYQALKFNDNLYVLLNCGNIVTRDTPTPNQKATKVTFINGQQVQARGPHAIAPGDEIVYRVYAENKGDGKANYFTIVDSIPAHTKYVGNNGYGANKVELKNGSPYPGYTTAPAGPYIEYFWYELSARQAVHVDLRVVVDKGAPNGTVICNKANYRSLQEPPEETNEICYIVKIEEPPKQEVPEEPEKQEPKTEISLAKSSRNLSVNPNLEAHDTTAYAGNII